MLPLSSLSQDNYQNYTIVVITIYILYTQCHVYVLIGKILVPSHNRIASYATVMVLQGA